MAFVRWRGKCAQLLATIYTEKGSKQLRLALLPEFEVSQETRNEVGRKYPNIQVDWIQISRSLAQLGLSMIVFLLLAFGWQSAFASDTNATVVTVINLNGVQIPLNAVVRGDDLYLPVRAISEALGYEVSWSYADKAVGIQSKDREITLKLIEAKVIVGGHESFLRNTHEMVKNRNYLTDTFFSENLALKVQWDKTNHVVTLSSVRENAITIVTVKKASETKALRTTVQYPVIEGLADKDIQIGLNAVFKKQADQAVAEGVKNASDLSPYVLKHPDIPWKCETYFNYRVTYNQNGFLSLVFQDYQYAGGAHGSTIQTSFTIPLESGQLLTLKDLFTSGAEYQAVINSSVKTQMDEMNLTVELFEPFSGIGGNSSFYLFNNGVTVYFQQYEIMPYAAGIQEFTTGYTTLDGLLKEQILLKENTDPDKAATVLLPCRKTSGYST